MVELCKMGCLLAEVIDPSVVFGTNGSAVVTENRALNMKMDVVVKYRGRYMLSLEVEQTNAGEDLLRAIDNMTPNPGANIILGPGRDQARAALRKVNCNDQYSVCANSG